MKELKLPTPDGGGWIDGEGITWSDKESWLFSRLLDLCGCRLDETYRHVFQILETHYNAKGYEIPYYSDLSNNLHIAQTEVEIILMLLNNAGLLEHGTACRASWITEEGRTVFEWLSSSDPLGKEEV